METEGEQPPLTASGQRDVDRELSHGGEHYSDDGEEDPPIDIFNQDNPPSVVMRDEWGALPPFSRQPLSLPVKYIRFTCTNTLQCHQREDCDAMVRMMQQDAIQKRKIPDIDYNFLVGGDIGYIYEGRGWFVDATRPKKLQYLRGSCLDIAFIGTYTQADPPLYMRLNAEVVIKLGQMFGYVVQGGLIDREPVVIPFRDAADMRVWSAPSRDYLDPAGPEYDTSRLQRQP